MDRGDIQLSFSWIFAIIVGGAILGLAIFAVTKIIEVSDISHTAQTGKEIGILLNPIETGFETGKSNLIRFPVRTRIYSSCDNFGTFGRQKIEASQESFGKWRKTDMEISFQNKYIFSDRMIEGKEFYLFSKPFYFPYKVSDLIYMSSSEKIYCFRDAPEEIKREINNLNQKNLKTGNCEEKDIIICFSGSCEIRVDISQNRVIKKEGGVYFETDALMYAAIFSDKETYECQLKRLMKKTKELSLIYMEKEKIVITKGCDSNLGLIALASQTSNFENSGSLNFIYNTVKDISARNQASLCRLW